MEPPLAKVSELQLQHQVHVHQLQKRHLLFQLVQHRDRRLDLGLEVGQVETPDFLKPPKLPRLVYGLHPCTSHSQSDDYRDLVFRRVPGTPWNGEENSESPGYEVP